MFDVSSILDLSIRELEELDIENVRQMFLYELMSISILDEFTRKNKFQSIFEKLFSFQSCNMTYISKDDHLLVSEQRIYADLISTPGLLEIPYVKEFLNNDFKDNGYENYKKRTLLLSIFNYYENHSKEDINKFNYIFRSSDLVSCVLLDSNLDLDFYFSEAIMKSFSKEELSQLIKFNFARKDDREKLDVLFSKDNRDVLYVVSVLNNYVKSLIGHSSEFLEAVLNLLEDEKKDNFIKLLESSYNEINNSKDSICVRELINYIMYHEYDKNNLGEDNDISSFGKLINLVFLRRNRNHYCILKMGTLEKVENNTFDVVNDFKDIETEVDLVCFKDAFLYNIYGISFDEARLLISEFGQYIDDLEKSVLDCDREIFMVLKSVKNIVGLNKDCIDFEDKIDVLRNSYYDILKLNGINYQHHIASSMILKSLFSKMFINTYNNRLFDENKVNVMYEDNGVKVIDAGVNFDIILTSFMGVTNFYNGNLNLKSKWNTASYSTSQGICCSYINNQNLGIISLDLPILGFRHIPNYSLNAMGPYDIFSNVNVYNLRRVNHLNKRFVPVNAFGNETRYGYNELLIDRFLMDDKKNSLKLQPSYVVFYKFNDNYKDSDIYNKSLKVAKDFNIPIVMIDVLKVKDYEKKEINLLEEELFSKDECNSSLLNDIVVRYVNNYVGSHTFVNTDGCDYFEDFSVKGMEEFFDKIFKKINSISDNDLRSKWIDSVEEVYLNEKNKYRLTKKISPYALSVQNFILRNYEIEQRIKSCRGECFDCRKLKTGIVFLDIDGKKLLNEKNDVSSNDIIKVQLPGGYVGVFVFKEEYNEETKTIIDFINDIKWGTTVIVNSDYRFLEKNGMLLWGRTDVRQDVILLENLVLSYFFEDCHNMLIEDLINFDFDMDIKFKCSDEFDFIKEVKNSQYNCYLDSSSFNFIQLDEMFVNLYLERIFDMEEKDFLRCFSPVINKLSEENGESFESIACKLLDKKKNIKKVFNSLLSSNLEKSEKIKK